MNTCSSYAHTQEGPIELAVNTTPVPKRNIDHVNVVSRLSCAFTLSQRSTASRDSGLLTIARGAEKAYVIDIGHCFINRTRRAVRTPDCGGVRVFMNSASLFDDEQPCTA